MQLRFRETATHLFTQFTQCMAAKTRGAFWKLVFHQDRDREEVKLLVESIESVIRRKRAATLQSFKIHAGFGQTRKMAIMSKALNLWANKWQVMMAETYSLLKIQHIMRNLTVIYYIGCNIMKTIFDKRLAASMECLRTNWRIESYRSFYTSFWKWKISNMEASFYVKFRYKIFPRKI